LEKRRPEVAQQIRLAIATWPGKAVDTDIVRRIGAHKADVRLLKTALDRRKSLQANVADDLRALNGKSGTVRGLFTVLAGDRQQQAALLDGTEHEAQRALLAAARLIREPLPIDKVGKLLKTGDKELALAAERYLESEDSAPARRLIYDHHPGEIVILGARMDFDPGHVSYGEFDTWEKRLRDEMLGNNSPTEIYALLSAG
jgi:hypothetical protein